MASCSFARSFNGKKARHSFAKKQGLWVGFSTNDFAEAYHGIPNLPNQLELCVVGLRNPETNRVEFYISYTHLFGLSAAVVNFNRLPERMAAACRRIGCCTTWHLFDDQGCWSLIYPRSVTYWAPQGTVS